MVCLAHRLLRRFGWPVPVPSASPARASSAPLPPTAAPKASRRTGRGLALLLLGGLTAAAASAAGGQARAASPLDLLNGLAKLGPHQVETGIAYGPGTRHQLDIYRPVGKAGPRPVIVFFYGGSWEEGDRAMYRFVGAALANQGFLTVIPDYRVYPEVRFPDFLRDGAQAVKWARDHAAAYGGDPREIVLMGHSAGAHIAAMLTLDRTWLGAVGLTPRRDIRGMVGLAGPYDFLPLKDAKLQTIFGPQDQLARTQPITFADGRSPPVFLAAGRFDFTVDPGNTTRLAARIRAQGGVATDVLYPGVDHATIIGAVSPALRLLAPVLSDTTAFVRSVTRSAVPAAE